MVHSTGRQWVRQKDNHSDVLKAGQMELKKVGQSVDLKEQHWDWNSAHQTVDTTVDLTVDYLADSRAQRSVLNSGHCWA